MFRPFSSISSSSYFFFLMIRRPPRPTLFPTRRSSDLGGEPPHPPPARRARAAPRAGAGRDRPARGDRSEEHTSELQSLTNLVCRLLLEKKKKNKSIDDQIEKITIIDHSKAKQALSCNL